MNNDEIKIESGIPMPTTRYEKSGCTEILKKMNVGDSALISTPKAASWRAQSIRLGMSVVIRKIDSEQARMWRKS